MANERDSLFPISDSVMSRLFLGLEADFATSQTVVFGAPFDSTCSFRPGTRFASQAMRQDFSGLESYSPYLDRDLSELEVHDAGDLELPFGQSERTLDIVEAAVERCLEAGKQVVMLGGEHLLTLAPIRALSRHYEDLEIVHFDAHTDLRDDYLGNSLSHATVMKRCWELTGDGRIHQFGIRSGERSEFLWAREHLDFHPLTLSGTVACAQDLRERKVPVYLSLDLDVLDPSVFPGTGTPEAGGASFLDLLTALMDFQGVRIVGFDLMELSPHYDASGVSTAVACKLLREMLLAYAPRD